MVFALMQANLLANVSVIRPPERREVPAEVQFEVAPNTVTDTTNLRAARLRSWRRDIRHPLACLALTEIDGVLVWVCLDRKCTKTKPFVPTASDALAV